MEIKFDQFINALPDAARPKVPKSRLVIWDRVDPFVPPTLSSSTDDAAAVTSAEVIFIEAPAAVGKSTVARFLSASRRTPLLDLARVPVATGSLKALISDLGDDAIERFHGGKLPVIVDAIDEGRMLSGEKGFEAFLDTSGEFLLSDRRELHKPKLVVLGRPESVELTKMGLEISGGGLTTSSVRLSFFDQAAAYEMINSYANTVSKPSSAYRKNPGPVREVIAAYFRAIESALGLQAGQLWVDEMGRAFAGYAPVLSALGLILADVDNFRDIENQLKSEGTTQAWGVIEKVLMEILDRERNKLCDQLGPKISVAVPAEAYDAEEQLTFIAQYVQGQPLTGSKRVRFSAKDRQAYDTLVAGYLKEHPFVRERKLDNAVLGSVVLGHAVVHDLLQPDLGMLAKFSNQPFLWRSVRKQLSQADSLIDGRYLGYLLASFWTEPLPEGDRIIVRSAEPGLARAFLSRRGSESALSNVTLPITFFGVMRDCDVDVEGAVEFQGQMRGSQAVFEARSSRLICNDLQVKVDLLVVHGDLWIESRIVVSSPKLELALRDGARVGWGGGLTTQHPWNKYEATLEPPKAPGDTLTTLLAECVRRLPGTVTFQRDYSLTDDDRWRWAVRAFPTEMPALIKLLVEHKHATVEHIPVNQVQVHLKVSWPELLRAAAQSEPPEALRAFITAARSKIT